MSGLNELAGQHAHKVSNLTSLQRSNLRQKVRKAPAGLGGPVGRTSVQFYSLRPQNQPTFLVSIMGPRSLFCHLHCPNLNTPKNSDIRVNYGVTISLTLKSCHCCPKCFLLSVYIFFLLKQFINTGH